MSIESILSKGTTIVAATERLARDLRVRISLERRRCGERVWPAPAIHSFREWVERSWTSCWPEQQLLHQPQLLSLWLYAVEKSGAGDALLSRTAAARQARHAGSLAERYQLDVRPGPFATRDEIVFHEWHGLVQETLAKRGWITEDQLPAELRRLHAAGRWVPERALQLVGFVDETTTQTLLFEQLAARGVEVNRMDVMEPLAATVVAARPKSRTAQYRQAACRIKSILAPYVSGTEVEPPRIAVLVPDARAARAILEPILAEYVAPHTSVAGPERSRIPWRFARGVALSEQPLIATAVDVVNLDTYRNGADAIARLILSPYLFPDATSTERSVVEYRIRSRGGSRFSLRAVRRACLMSSRQVGGGCGSFCERLEGWLEQLEATQPSRVLPSVWADWIERLLTAAAWAAHDLTGEQTQALDAWRECLDALRAMDSQVREIDKPRLVAWLREILTDRVFQPAAEHLQPVHILSYFDVIGSQYDHAIVLDLTAAEMPEPTSGTGFIPTERLAAAGVPNATPVSALERGQRWLQQLCQSAAQITLMAPRHDDNGAALMPSPLYQAWPEDAEGGALCISHLEGILRKGVATEPVLEEEVPRIQDSVEEDIRGGVSILKNVEISPWVAFARHRLGLKPFPLAQDGIDAATQGELVHRALERIWKEIKSSDSLAAIDADGLERLVARHVALVQSEDGILSAAAYGQGMAAVERQRALELLIDWMNLERSRVLPFEVIACEGRAKVVIEALALEVRIDRIDAVQTQGGVRYVVLDYKSLATLGAGAWDPDSLAEPQLPVYATFAELTQLGVPRVDGIAFAKVAEGACDFVLASCFTDRLTPDAKGSVGAGDQDWQKRLADWSSAINKSCRRFIEGDLSLDRQKFERDRFARDLDPLVRPRVEPAIQPGVNPF